MTMDVMYSAEGRYGTEDFTTISEVIICANSCSHDGLGAGKRCCVAKAVMAVSLASEVKPSTKHVDKIRILPAHMLPYRDAIRTIDISGNGHFFTSDSEAFITVDDCRFEHQSPCTRSLCVHAHAVISYFENK